MKLDWKIHSLVLGFLILCVFGFFLEKVFFFFLTILVTLLLALLLRFLQPLKYVGIELVTLSTIFVGIVYGPVFGGLYGFIVTIAHFMIGHYYIGSYLTWVLPEYVALGILSGILKTGIIGPIGVSVIIGINLINLLLTFLFEREQAGKLMPFIIGNITINSLLFIQFFEAIVNFVI